MARIFSVSLVVFLLATLAVAAIAAFAAPATPNEIQAPRLALDAAAGTGKLTR